MKACFFSNAPIDLIKTVEAYQSDIRILNNMRFDVKIANKLRKIPWDCDIYFAWWASSGAKAVLISKLVKKPCIIIAGGSDVSLTDESPAGYKKRNFIHKRAIKWTLRNANAILAVSEDVYRSANFLGAKKIYLVHNCIDTEKYKPLKLKRKDIILMVSHLSKQNVDRKRMTDVINSMSSVIKKYPKAKLVFIGKKLEGYQELSDLVKKLDIGENVDFLGSVSEKEKIAFYSKSKVFACPSEHEGFGLAMAEGMSCELPPVVTERGALREVVGDTGIYVSLGNIDEIASAINKLLVDNKFRENLGKKCRDRIISNFSFKKREEKIGNIIKEILKNKEDCL